MRRTLAALCLSLAALPFARAAEAPVRHLELRWHRLDAHCIDADELARSVEATLGRPVFNAFSAPSGVIEGTVESVADGRFRVRIRLARMDGTTVAQRTLDTTGDCHGFDKSIALVMAVMIDDLDRATSTSAALPSVTTLASTSSVERAAPSASVAPIVDAAPSVSAAAAVVPPVVSVDARDSATGATATAASSEAPIRDVPPSTVRPVDVAFGLGIGAVASLTPAVTRSLVARGEIALPHWVPMTLTFRSEAATEASAVTSGASGDVGGRFTSWRADLAACPQLRFGLLRVGACLGFGAGAMSASPLGLTRGGDLTRAIAYMSALPNASLRLVGSVALRVEAGLLFMVVRDPWGFDAADGTFVRVHEPSRVAPTGAVTLEFATGS